MQRVGQQGGGDSTKFHYKNLVHAIYTIVREEGIRTLFNVSFARILFHVPNVAITMSVVEMLKP